MCVGISGIHLRAIECSWSYSTTCFQNQRNLHFKNYYHIPQGQWVNTKHDISHPWTCHICFTCAFKLSIPVYHSSSIAPLQSDWDGAILPGLLVFLPPSWRHAHAHFGFAHSQQPLRWLKPFLKHWYVKLYELIAPHTLKWTNSVIKLGHFVWNIIYCLSLIKFKDRWVIFFIYDSFCWTKSPTAASLGSRNDAM